MTDNARPLGKLARMTGVQLTVTTVLTYLLVVPGQITDWQLANVRTYDQVADALALNRVLTMVFGAVAVTSWLVAASLFLRWLVRARDGIESSPGAAPPRYKRGWAVAGWFLPVANLVLPALVVDEVAHASGVRRAGLLVWSWWLALVGWVAILVTLLVSPNGHTGQSVVLYQNGSDIDPQWRAAVVELYSPGYEMVLLMFVVLTAAAILGVLVVRAITVAQVGRVDGAEEASSPPFQPLRRPALLATAAVVTVTGILLSPALVPEPDPIDASDISHSGAFTMPGEVLDGGDGNGQGDRALIVVSVAVGAASATPTIFDPFTSLGLVGWSLLAGGSACFLWWLARARRNLDAFPDAVPRFRASWSVAAWFVPGAGPVLVGMVVSDIARESHPAAPGDAAGPINTPARYEAVRLVWAWLLVSLMWSLTYPPLWEAMRPLRPPTVGWLPTTILLVVAALLAIAVIRRVTTAQHRRTTDPAPSAPPEE